MCSAVLAMQVVFIRVPLRTAMPVMPAEMPTAGSSVPIVAHAILLTVGVAQVLTITTRASRCLADTITCHVFLVMQTEFIKEHRRTAMPAMQIKITTADALERIVGHAILQMVGETRASITTLHLSR